MKKIFLVTSYVHQVSDNESDLSGSPGVLTCTFTWQRMKIDTPHLGRETMSEDVLHSGRSIVAFAQGDFNLNRPLIDRIVVDRGIKMYALM